MPSIAKPSQANLYLIEFTICFEITAIYIDCARSLLNERTNYMQDQKKHTNTQTYAIPIF